MSVSSMLRIPAPVNKHIKIFYYQHETSPVITAACNNRIWEKKLFNLYKDMIQPHHTIVDVGAFIGSHTVIFSLMAHKGKVIAFEPCRKPYESLSKTIDYNKMDNILLLKNVVTNKVGEEEVMGSTYDGDSCIRKLRAKKRFVEFENVKSITIDSFNLERCDILKIDAENSEYLVLEGAAETIKKHRPIIFFETFRKGNGEHLTKLDQWTKENFYKYTWLKGDDYLLESI